MRSRQRAWAKANRDKINRYARNQHFKSSYGISVEERDAMFVLQGSCCAACGGTDPKRKGGWVVDHDHATDKIRGILCQPCNLALGLLEDSEIRLLSLITYLARTS